MKAREKEMRVCMPEGVQSIVAQLDEDHEGSMSWYLLQDRLNMVNSKGFVLGEECSRSS